MADLQNRLTGNYYIAWLSRCDDAWRWLLSDRGPYTPMHVLKKQHHADCQRIAKEMLLTQLADKMQAKRLGLKNNPRRGTAMKRRKSSALQYFVVSDSGSRRKISRAAALSTLGAKVFSRVRGEAARKGFASGWRPGTQTVVVRGKSRNPRRYRRNVRHGHHRHHSALSKRGLMTKRERRRFTKRMKRHHRALRLKYREKWGRGAGH